MTTENTSSQNQIVNWEGTNFPDQSSTGVLCVFDSYLEDDLSHYGVKPQMDLSLWAYMQVESF